MVKVKNFYLFLSQNKNRDIESGVDDENKNDDKRKRIVVKDWQRWKV